MHAHGGASTAKGELKGDPVPPGIQFPKRGSRRGASSPPGSPRRGPSSPGGAAGSPRGEPHWRGGDLGPLGELAPLVLAGTFGWRGFNWVESLGFAKRRGGEIGSERAQVVLELSCMLKPRQGRREGTRCRSDLIPPTKLTQMGWDGLGPQVESGWAQQDVTSLNSVWVQIKRGRVGRMALTCHSKMSLA